ncbi:MAG: glycosyl hydrolase family 18 protein [Janthinobacterium lividum]
MIAAGIRGAKAVAQRAPAASFPQPAIVGYWQNFKNAAPAQTLAQVPSVFSVVVVAFATPTQPLDGSFSFELDPSLAGQVPGGYTLAQCADDIRRLHAEGRIVLLSVGGQHHSFALSSDAMVSRFVESAAQEMQQWQFDGLDIDLENVITPENSAFLEKALRQLRMRMGPHLILTMAPQVSDMASLGGGSHVYWTMAHDLGSTITMINTQFYNAGPKRGLDGNVYQPGTVDFVTSQIDAQLREFPSERIGVGLTASPGTRGYLAPAAAHAILACLMDGQECGSYRPVARYPHLRGAMIWSTNWDADAGRTLSQSLIRALQGSTR